MNVQLKYVKNDHDDMGNPFPALHIRFEDGKQNKFITQDDYPRILGLRDETEIWDNELPEFKHIQLPTTYIQPYAAFLDDRMQVWFGFMPSKMSEKPDIEISYLDLTGETWHDMKFPNFSIQ